MPWPLPADAGQVREKGYFVEGGKESLPPKWDAKVMARPRLDENVSGVDAYHKTLAGAVDGNGEPTIAVFLKTGPPGRARRARAISRLRFCSGPSWSGFVRL